MTSPENIIPLPAPKPARKFDTRQFKHRGEMWRLFKRSADADATWYFYFERAKQRFGPSSMKTWLFDLAAERAKQAIDAFYANKTAAFDAAMGRRPQEKYSTIGDVLAVVLQLTIKAKPATRNDYVANLYRVLRKALSTTTHVPTDAQIAALSLSVLDDDLAARFFAVIESDAAQIPEQNAARRLRASWLSMFHNAAALFADRPLYQYRKVHALTLPDLKDWRNGAKIHGPNLPRAGGFQVPDDKILRRTLIEWVKIGNTPGYQCRNKSHKTGSRSNGGKVTFARGPLSEIDRRNMFLAIGLELSCGLRISEVPKARWDWIKIFQGVPHLSSRDVNVKNATGEIHVVPIDPYWNFMLRTAKRNNWFDSGNMLICRPQQAGAHAKLRFNRGGHSDVTDRPPAHVGWWLRDLGWETQKSNHALRDWTASNITMKYGLDAARDWCRHSSRATTEANYNRFRSLAGQVNIKKLNWFKWAK